MISLNRNRRKSGNSLFLPLVVFAVIAVIVIQMFAPGIFFRLLYFISIPFTYLRDKTGGIFSSFGTFITSKSTLEDENGKLREDISKLNTALLSLQALQNENDSLKKMASKPAYFVFATVVSRPPFSPYDIFIISSGSNDGIAEENPVFADDGTPIGIVENVYPTSAKIALFSSSGNDLAVMMGDKDIESRAIGLGGGDFKAKVPDDRAPKVGDPVYMPRFKPRALGVVKKISLEPTDAFATVFFSYPQNIFEISYVSIDVKTHIKINEATTTSE